MSDESRVILGHTFRPMDDADWSTFAGAEPGTLVAHVGENLVLLWHPSTGVSEYQIDDAGYTAAYAWGRPTTINVEPDFRGDAYSATVAD